MGKNEELLKRRQAIVPKAIPLVTQLTVDRAKGATLIDAEGNEIIDFAGGIGAMNVGHCADPVVRAIQEQAAKLQHTCIHLVTYEPYVALCEKLASMFPHGDRTMVMLVNSGAEAVENAVKIARQATGRPGIICYTEAFHGRTLLATSLSSKTALKVGIGPYAPELYRLPFPNYFRYGDGLSKEAFIERELTRFRQLFTNTVPAKHVAAVILECVQGEGGFVPVPGEYLRGLRKLCDEFGILLICDEVQCGFCRTGKWACYEHHGVTPDLSCWAKSMSGGLPIAAIVGRADIIDAVTPGTLGGTYGGNPVACMAALANIKLMEELKLNDRAVAVGKRIRQRFESLQARCPVIGDVRGIGAMIGMEFVEDGDPNKPATQLVKDIIKCCADRGLLLVPAGLNGQVIRILCPLVITDDQLTRGLDILEQEVLRLASTKGVAEPLAASCH